LKLLWRKGRFNLFYKAMKILEHLLKNSYAFLLAFCLIFLVGPKFINISREKKEITQQDNQISKLSLDYLNPNTTNYLTFETELNSKIFKISFKKGDNQYFKLIDFFQKFSNKDNLDLPITLSNPCSFSVFFITPSFPAASPSKKKITSCKFFKLAHRLGVFGG